MALRWVVCFCALRGEVTCCVNVPNKCCNCFDCIKEPPWLPCAQGFLPALSLAVSGAKLLQGPVCPAQLPDYHCFVLVNKQMSLRSKIASNPALRRAYKWSRNVANNSEPLRTQLTDLLPDCGDVSSCLRILVCLYDTGMVSGELVLLQLNTLSWYILHNADRQSNVATTLTVRMIYICMLPRI